MEEKLFWISLISGVYAFGFKQFFRNPRRTESSMSVGALNGLFWAFVGVAAGYLLVSYKELPTLSLGWLGAAAAAGGALGLLWVLPRMSWGARILWPVAGVAYAASLGGFLGVPGASMGVAMVGLGLLGLATGQMAATMPPSTTRAVVSGYLAVWGVLSGYWMTITASVDGSPSVWMVLALGLGGAVVGRTWSPRGSWSADENERLLRESQEWADTGFSAILLAAAIMYVVVQAFKIPSGSMRSTLLEGDHLFVNKFIYGVRVPYTEKRVARWRAVQRGDIVVFRFPTDDHRSPHYGKDFIKRAIGLPGDVIEIKNKQVFVNGLATTEPYAQFEDDFVIPPSPTGTDHAVFADLWRGRQLAKTPTAEWVRDNFGPITVPPGNYFVMGDNRDRSYDGRFWGPLPDSHLKGRAWLLYLPFSRWKIIR